MKFHIANGKTFHGELVTGHSSARYADALTLVLEDDPDYGYVPLDVDSWTVVGATEDERRQLYIAGYRMRELNE